jgi:hypothetical protein
MTDLALNLVISREEVSVGDTTRALMVLRSLLESPQRALSQFQQVDLAFHGYDDVAWEIYEIDNVRAFVTALDESFPFWLFFMTKRNSTLQAIMLCFMPPFLTEAGRRRVFPKHLEALLTNRWLPATNQICQWVGFSDEQIDALLDEVAEYFSKGPRV